MGCNSSTPVCETFDTEEFRKTVATLYNTTNTTLNTHLTETIKCLVALVLHLSNIQSKISSVSHVNLSHIENNEGFYRNMEHLGLFVKDPHSSKGKVIFQQIFKLIKAKTTRNDFDIQQLISALNLYIYIIIILREKISEAVSNFLNDKFTIQVSMKFKTIKTCLLSKIEQYFALVYENTLTNSKNPIVFDLKDIIQSTKSLDDHQYDLIKKKGCSFVKQNITDGSTAEINPEVDIGIIVQTAETNILDQSRTGGSISYKHQIKQIRKLLTNKKLTAKQKEQYKRKINKLKLKIEKEQKLNKINKIKDKLKKANTILKNKKLTDKQKQQLKIKIKNYKNQIKNLSS